jgi:hypothetical protein
MASASSGGSRAGSVRARSGRMFAANSTQANAIRAARAARRR